MVVVLLVALLLVFPVGLDAIVRSHFFDLSGICVLLPGPKDTTQSDFPDNFEKADRGRTWNLDNYPQILSLGVLPSSHH